jgi:hypothetical protein
MVPPHSSAVLYVQHLDGNRRGLLAQVCRHREDAMTRRERETTRGVLIRRGYLSVNVGTKKRDDMSTLPGVSKFRWFRSRER